MTHAFAPFPATFVVRPRLSHVARDVLRIALLPLAVAVAVFGGVTVAYGAVVDSMEASQRAPSEREPTVSADIPMPADAEAGKSKRSRQLCGTCGIVETIRRLDPVGDLPAAYEFTLRLRDGSTRTSSAASLANWRTGDHIMVIGGARASLQ